MKQVIFEGNSLEIIRAFPDNARQRAGYEIDRVQRGLEPLSWKPLSSIGTGVREIRIQVGMQYRLIYIAKLGDKVHILHCFQKKSQKTLRSDIELVSCQAYSVGFSESRSGWAQGTSGRQWPGPCPQA